MEDFRKLEHEMRVLALVGNFLQHWSFVEARLNEVIVKSLGLQDLNGLIVVRNIQLRDKLKIAKTAIHISFIGPQDQAEIYKKLIDKIGDFSLKRNIVAHELFIPSDQCDGVHFLVTKANGKITFPSEHWSTIEFAKYYAQMREFDDAMEVLIERLGTSSLVKALTAAEGTKKEPMTELSQLGLGGLLSPQPLGLLGSNPLPATPETSDEMPPKRRRKASPRKRL